MMKTKILLLSLLFALSSTVRGQIQLEVGQTYQCFIEDYANRAYDWINISWEVSSGLTTNYYGNYVRTVSFSEYKSGTYSVTAKWTETDMSDPFDPFRHKSHTWTFTCKKPSDIKVTSISLSPTTMNLEVGKSQYISETVYPSNATNKSVSWSSSPTGIVTVSSTGEVKAIKEGTTTVTCKANDGSGKYATCKVNVSKIINVGDYIYAKLNDGIQLTFKVLDTELMTCALVGYYNSNTTQKVSLKIPSNVEGFKVVEISHDFSIFDKPEIVALDVPNTVVSIGYYAFSGCSSLTTITGCENVESIGHSAFGSKISPIPWYTNQPDGAMYIGKVLYYYKGELPPVSELNIREGIVSICDQGSSSNIFDSYEIAQNLVAVTIPKSMKSIGFTPFTNCSNLKSIKVSPDNPYLDSRDNCNAVIETSTNTLLIGCAGTTIPSTVKVIRRWAATSIENGRKTTCIIPNSVEKIEEYAFYYTNYLKHVSIGSNVKSIGKSAFEGCNELKSVRCTISTPLEIDESVFKCNIVGWEDRIYDNATLVVPKGSKSMYMNAPVWSNFKNVVESDGANLTDGDIFNQEGEDGNIIIYMVNSSANKTCSLIGPSKIINDDIIIPSIANGFKVNEISTYAFTSTKEDSYSISSLTIPETLVGKIGSRAFYDCDKVTSITSRIKSPTEIYSDAFRLRNTDYNIYKTATLYVPQGTKSIYETTEGWSQFNNIVEYAIAPITTKGDVNGDGQVNGTDLVALTNIILGKSSKTDAADVNGDGYVNGTDYVALANIVLGRSNAKATAMAKGAIQAAATTGLSIEQFDIKAGETKEMVIDLTNPSDDITLVQFDLRLPNGLSVKQNGGEYDFDIAGRTTWRKHSLDANATNGIVRFLLASSSNATLSGTEGAVIKMTITADNSFTGGDIQLENILMVTPAEKEIKQDFYTYHVGQSQQSPASTGLAIEPFSISAGGEAEMVIDMTNPDDEITLVQFDLRLPAGLSVKQTGGDYDYDIAGRTTWRKHSLDANATNGIVRFLLASSSNATLSGTEGAIIKTALKADNTFAGGVVKLENILLVTPAEKEIKQPDVNYNIGATGIKGVVADDIKKDATIYNLSGQRLDKPRKGINIIGGKKVIIK